MKLPFRHTTSEPIPSQPVQGDNDTLSPHWRFTITSTGAVIQGYLGDAHEVIVPSNIWCCPVVGIDKHAFHDSYHTDKGETLSNKVPLKKITLPEGLQFIDASAFAQCNYLEEIYFPDDLCRIGDNAFAGCTALTQLHLPDGLKQICNNAFANCSGLTKISPHRMPKHIGEGIFECCTALTEVTLPEGLTEIPKYMFDGCTALTTVHLPSTLLRIGSGAFCDCTQLASIEFPEGLTTIDTYAFRGCTSLKEVVLPSSMKLLGKGVFQDCTALTRAPVPNHPVRFHINLFKGCSSLADAQGFVAIWGNLFDYFGHDSHVVIPNSVTAIMTDTFLNRTELTSITMPASIKLIVQKAFSGCINLRSVTLPNPDCDVKQGAFENTPALQVLEIPAVVFSVLSTDRQHAMLLDVLDGWDNQYRDHHPQLIALIKPQYKLIHYLLFNGQSSAINKLFQRRELLDLADTYRHLDDAIRNKRQEISVLLTRHIAHSFSQSERDAYQMQREMAEWGLEFP